MAYSDWIITVPDEFYNKKTNTRINILDGGGGYKMNITNLSTNSVSGDYKTGRTKGQALKLAKKYMKKH